MLLEKLGVNDITIYDPGVVTERNYSNQVIYGTNHVGMNKVDALKSYMDYKGYRNEASITYFNEAIDDETDLIDITLDNQIIIVGVDSMKARASIADHVELLESGLLLDMRIGGMFTTGICLPLGNQLKMSAYKKTYLFSDEQAAPISCTEKTMIGVSVWTNQFITNAIWAYFENGCENYPSVVNVPCDTQRPRFVNLTTL